jgi:hypothetical protein
MRKTANKIALGELFIEAKKRVGHGQWLDYLEENFSLSKSTVENYMRISRGAAKIPNFGNLRLESNLLNPLFATSPKRGFAKEVRDAIFEEARTKWVGWGRAYEIEREIRRAAEQTYNAEIERIERGEDIPPWEEIEAPTEALADVSPPAVTDAISPSPQPPISHRDTDGETGRHRDTDINRETGRRRAQFQQVIKQLKLLLTKRAIEFAGVCTQNELHEVIDFLSMVAEATAKLPGPTAVEESPVNPLSRVASAGQA